jgi:osmotically inducible protein OsmC
VPRRRAVTRWRGSLEEGTGNVTLATSGLATYEVSFPTRAAEEPGAHTSPEELIAAAHASCFAMQLSALLGEEGGSDIELEVAATVHLGPDPAGGFRIPRIELEVAGSAAGVAASRFVELAEQAKASCPVSKALSGTEIILVQG